VTRPSHDETSLTDRDKHVPGQRSIAVITPPEQRESEPRVGAGRPGQTGHEGHDGYGGHQRVLRWVLGNPLRRLVHPPGRLLAPFVAPGMTVLEPGPGVGFFTIELARRVGQGGRVVAVDVRPEMLDELRRRAARAGVLHRIDARLAQRDHLGIGDLTGTVDLAFAFAMVHELPDADRFFAEVAATLRPGGTLLLAEPAGHVGAERFAAELRAAERAGLLVDRDESRVPRVRFSRAVVVAKPG
jgi:SAM-dependent methyltransferase